MDIANLAAYLGSGLAMGLGAIGSGWGAGYVVTGALNGMARQPVQQPGLMRSMLINQALASNPSIFALVISILLYNMGAADLDAPDSWAQAAAFLAAGLCVGIGTLGSGAGSGLVGSEAVDSVARVPSSQSRVTMMMLIAHAWAQTPCIFALVIALVQVYVISGFNQMVGTPADFVNAGKILGMGICMGAGAVGPAIGIAFVGSRVCNATAVAPAHMQKIRNTFFVGAAVSESTAIYALVISLLLKP
jgi:F0F1-type ATP synthase membrane subunit c/vacuolar-type H+-ATPase subunit K